MNLISWSPFRDLDDMFDRFSRGADLQEGSGLRGTTRWRPAANIVENDKEYTIKADLPEVKREDIDVNVDNGIVTISGERRVEKSSDDEKEHRRETFYGSFARSFALPHNVDQSKINAECKDGVLTVHLPKVEQAQPKSISIKVS